METREYLRAERMLDPPCDCYLIDLLPKRAPEERAAQYTALERYFRQPKEIKRLVRRLVRLMLKLNCYEHMVMQKGIGWVSFSPERITSRLRVCLAGEGEAVSLIIGQGKAQLILDSGDLYLSLYTADGACAELVSQLAWSEGLFFRRLDG